MTASANSLTGRKTADSSSRTLPLGGLLNAHESFTNVHDILRVDHFYNPELGAIYGVFAATYRQNDPADLMTLSNKSGVNVQVLVETMGEVFLGAQRRTALAIVELSQKRGIYRSLKEIAGSLKDMSIEDLAGKITATAVGITLDGTQKRVLAADKLTDRVAELQDERRKDPGLIRGIHTGYPCLDLTLRGLRPRRMTLLVAATGFGKSTLAVNIFSNVVQTGTKALLISTENDIDDNLDRMCGIVSGLELKEIEGGYKPERVTESFASRFKGKTAFISDNSPRTIHEVIGTIARYVLQHGVELVFVDYIGEIAMDGVKNENEEARLTRYSQALLEASRTLGCHIVVLAQLNREGNRKPTRGYLDSLKGLYLYESDLGEAAYNNIRQLAAKYLQKNGKEPMSGEPTARSNALYYYKQAMRFDDAEAADRYKEEYISDGGTSEGIRKSIAKAHPMSMLPLNERAKFRQSLSADELETLQRGIEWYRQVYAP